jgi:hypothetical protein
VISKHRLWLRVTPALRLLVAALGSAGCLVSDPPVYEQPGMTPPFLDLVAATPMPGRVIVREAGTDPVIKFDIPVRSEDNGEELWFALYRDFSIIPNNRNRPVFGSSRIPPGTFDETDRAIRFDWTLDSSVTQKCHQLTLLVSHESTWVLEDARPDPLRGIGDTAMATWWLNHIAAGQDPNTLVDCPTLSSGVVQP